MAQCNVDALIADAACFACQPLGIQQLLELQLLCEILNSAGGGGLNGKEIFSGNGDPNGVITPGVTDAIYRQLDSLPAGLIWTWQGAGPWIAPSP